MYPGGFRLAGVRAALPPPAFGAGAAQLPAPSGSSSNARGTSALPQQLGGQLHSGDSGLEAAAVGAETLQSSSALDAREIAIRSVAREVMLAIAADGQKAAPIAAIINTCNQVVAAAIGDPGLVVRRGTLMVDSVDGTPSLAGVCELPTSVLRSGSSPDITDQPGVLNTTRGYVLMSRSFGMHMNVHLHHRSSADDGSVIGEVPLWRTGPPSHAEEWLMVRLREMVFDFRLLRGAFGRSEQVEVEHAVCTAWRMEQEVRRGVALGLEELWQAYARASNSAEAASILAAIQERVPEDLRPSGMDDTGQSEALEAAIQCATTAQASALDSLMAEEGWTEEEDFMEALDAAWQAANQCGDVVEAERLLARMDEFSDLTDQLFAEARRIREEERDVAAARQSEAQHGRMEVAIEARDERHVERVARGALFDDLQRSWSDARYAAELEVMQRLEESELHEREVDGEEEVAERRARATDGEETEVVEVTDRWGGLAA